MGRAARPAPARADEPRPGRGMLFAAAPGAGLVHALRLPAAARHHVHLTVAIVLGLCVGVLTRAVLLRLDSSPFPSRPHGRINFLFLGFVAASLGALAPAALLTANYTAGVFLAIGLSQFHQARQIDRDMLLALDHAEIVPRGRAYVEGLAMMTETRNYVVMLTAMLTTAGTLLFGVLPGLAVGVASGLVITHLAVSGATVGNMAAVEPAEVVHTGQDIRVGGVTVLSSPPVALVAALPFAVGVRVVPHDLAARVVLAEPGQRQAILHNLAANLGVREARDEDEAHGESAGPSPLVPRCVLEPRRGSLAVLTFPALSSRELAVQAVRRTPRLETLAHRPLRGRTPEQRA